MICQTKNGRQAIRGDIVIDTTGDCDVALSAGAEFTTGQYIVTTVFRLANVDTVEADRFEYEEPEEFARINREARRIIGGAWEMWWLKTPIPGVVWCNCPHMPGYDGYSVEDLTRAEYEGRERMMGLYHYVRENMPGFENSKMLGAAEQVGVRTTRMLTGEYVVTKDDIVNRRYFADTVCRGRDYYTPYRALLPKKVDQLIVAGRHYSAEPEAQKAIAGNSAVHGPGRGRRCRRVACVAGRHQDPRRGLPQDSEADAGAGRGSGRYSVRQCNGRGRPRRKRLRLQGPKEPRS